MLGELKLAGMVASQTIDRDLQQYVALAHRKADRREQPGVDRRSERSLGWTKALGEIRRARSEGQGGCFVRQPCAPQSPAWFFGSGGLGLRREDSLRFACSAWG